MIVLIRNMKLFNNIKEKDVEYIEGLLEKKTYFKGDIICNEGDKSNELYLIDSGKVDIIKKGTKVGELTSGQQFGEMALLENKERSADVVANGKVIIFILTKEKFFDLREKEPKIYNDSFISRFLFFMIFLPPEI